MQSKSPNQLNLNSYTQGNIQPSSQNPYVATSQNLTFQQRFEYMVKQVHQNDQILHQITTHMQHLTQQDNQIFDFYPQNALNLRYNDDEQKRIISQNDKPLNKMLNVLQQNNKLLKQQHKNWNYQFSKMVMFTQNLLKYNKIIRNFVKIRNKQIVKLVLAIKNTENSQLLQLQNILKQLQEQNGVLFDHYNKLKQKIKDKNSQELVLAKSIDVENQNKYQLQAKIKQYDNKEQHNGKLVSFLQSNQQQVMHRQRKLLADRDRLINLIKQYKDDHENLTIELRKLQNNLQDNTGLAHQKYCENKITQQANLQTLLQHAQKYNQNLSKQNQLQKKLQKNQNLLEQLSIIHRKQNIKLSEYTEQQKKIQKQYQQISNIQVKLLSQNQLLDLQIEQLKQKLQNKKIEKQKNLQQYDKQIKNTKNMKNDQIIRWNRQAQVDKRQGNKNIMEQKYTVDMQVRQISNLQTNMKEINKYIRQLMTQIRQFNKSNKQGVTSLKNRLSPTRNPYNN